MNHFFTQLPVIITQFSLALIKALTDQLKWLGSIYYHIETALLGTVADISLAILSLRYLFLLLLIGGALGYFGLWWFLAVYVLIILIAVVQFFRSSRLPPDPDVEKAHQELRDKSVKFLRIPLRALAMLVSLYFSWQFIDWKAITPSSFETLAEEKQLTPSTKDNTSTAVTSITEKATSAVSKDSVLTGQGKASDTVDESQWVKVGETKTCVMGWKTETSMDGWCSLGEFEAGEYRFETSGSMTKKDSKKNTVSIPLEGFHLDELQVYPEFEQYVKTYYPIPTDNIWGLVVKKSSSNAIVLASKGIILRDKNNISLSINVMNMEINWTNLDFKGTVKIIVLKEKS